MNNNSKEIIEKINSIEGLDDIISRKAIKLQLDSMKVDNALNDLDNKLGFSFDEYNKKFLKTHIGDYSNLTEDELIDKLVQIQKIKHIFGGSYLAKYNRIKKEYLKTNYGIDWLTPEECSTNINFF